VFLFADSSPHGSKIVNYAIAISYHNVHWRREKRRNVVNLFGLRNGRNTAVTRMFHHIRRDRHDSFTIMQSAIAMRSIRLRPGSAR
jgi:hypothetical protein